MIRLRLAAVPLALLLASPALASPGAEDPEATVIVIAPPAPVVVRTAPQPMPPGAAEAPPPPAVAAAPAPQTHAWSEVSHINGHPVPVGEQGSYLHRWKKTNLATNPLGWLMGLYGLSVSHAIHHNVAIRADANLYRAIEGDERGHEIGITAPIYLKRVYQGPFVEPGLIVRDFDADDHQAGLVGPQVNVGWHWTFDSGLNLALAFGVARQMSADAGEHESPIEPVGYFRVGYAY